MQLLSITFQVQDGAHFFSKSSLYSEKQNRKVLEATLMKNKVVPLFHVLF
jgi:hypothetical protein